MSHGSPLLTKAGEKLRADWCRHHEAFRAKNPAVRPFKAGVFLDGGTDSFTGRTYKCFWNTAAAKIIEKGFDPSAVAAFMFSRAASSRAAPDPRMVASDSTLSDFTKARAATTVRDFTDAIKRSVAADRVAFAILVRRYGFAYANREQAYEAALSDISISPLFRLHAATTLGNAGFVQKVLNQAKEQYLSYPDNARRVWDSLLGDDTVAAIRDTRQ